MAKKVFTKEQRELIVEEYVNKLTTLTDISKKIIMCDPSTIKRVLNEEGVTVCSGSPFSYKHWMCRGMIETEAKYKVKTLRPIHVEYWLEKGYSDEESILKSKYHTDNTLEACIYNHGEIEGRKKWGEILKKNVETNKKKSKRRVEYWVSEGYTEEESRQKVKEHQTTFTMEKCVEKYGEEEGVKIFESRQKKWRDSFEFREREKGGFNHDSSSKEFYQKKYPNNWFNNWLYGVTDGAKYGEYIRKVVNSCDTIEDYLEYVKNNKEIFLNKKISHAICRSKVFNYKMNLDHSSLLSYTNSVIYDKQTKTRFGYIIRVDGEMYRSRGEYEISKELKRLSIDFEYEKNYPGSKKKCDFYLTNEDVYIEYTGMLNLSKIRDDYDKIVRNYKNNIQKKKLICLENGLNCVFFSDINDVFNYIQK